MRIFVQNKKQGKEGMITVKNKQIKPDQACHKDIKSLARDAVQQGVRRIRSLHNAKHNTVTLVQVERVWPGDNHFPLVLIKFFEQKGYSVKNLDQHDSIDRKLTKLTDIVGDAALKKEIRHSLPTMSYLEKTAMLKMIRYAFRYIEDKNLKKYI